MTTPARRHSERLQTKAACVAIGATCLVTWYVSGDIAMALWGLFLLVILSEVR
jgi:hypothetical protein